VDQRFPQYIDNAYRAGSGTSMAAAVVSGGAALVLSNHPEWGPDRVKTTLMVTARPTASSDRYAVGSGVADMLAATRSTAATLAPPERHSSGLGSLDASRGRVRVRATVAPYTAVNGLLTSQLAAWDPFGFLTGNWTARTWPLSVWARCPWLPVQWHGDDWQGNNWHGNNWHGDWEGSTSPSGPEPSDRYGLPWKGAAWYGVWE
jgi:serine protease AprX